MSKYSPGKYAKFISDRSGVAFPYTRRIKEWTGALVDISEYEPKHPQLLIYPPPIEAIALFNPRPDRGRKESTSYYGFNPVAGTGILSSAEVGTVTVTTS